MKCLDLGMVLQGLMSGNSSDRAPNCYDVGQWFRKPKKQ